jgi:hypothetical protein
MRAVSLILTVAALSVASAAGRDAGPPFEATLDREGEHSGYTWSIDCSHSKRKCVTDFDGGVPRPIECPAGMTCGGGALP